MALLAKCHKMLWCVLSSFSSTRVHCETWITEGVWTRNSTHGCVCWAHADVGEQLILVWKTHRRIAGPRSWVRSVVARINAVAESMWCDYCVARRQRSAFQIRHVSSALEQSSRLDTWQHQLTVGALLDEVVVAASVGANWQDGVEHDQAIRLLHIYCLRLWACDMFWSQLRMFLRFSQ